MDELVGRLVAKAGIADAVAKKNIGMMLGYLTIEGPTEKVLTSIDQIPGAEAAIALSNRADDRARLMAGGLIARELLRFNRDELGADQTSEIIAGTPGPSQFA